MTYKNRFKLINKKKINIFKKINKKNNKLK